MSNSEADFSQEDSYKIKVHKAGNEPFCKRKWKKILLSSKGIFKVRKLNWKVT